MEEETIFSEDPIATANSWFSQGAEILHIVDLDGAIEGRPINDEIIFSIASEFPKKRIQVGGGVRNFSSASQYLDAGIERVIMGTSAVDNPEVLKEFCEQYPNRLVLGIDALNGLVKTQGWVKGSDITPLLDMILTLLLYKPFWLKMFEHKNIYQYPTMVGCLPLNRQSFIQITDKLTLEKNVLY